MCYITRYFVLAIITSVLLTLTKSVIPIEQFGAISNSDTIQSQFTNSKALVAALTAANISELAENRIVVLQHGKTYYSMPVYVENIHNVSLKVYGKWAASKSIRYWPKNKNAYQDYIVFQSCSGIQISGGGKIDGRGYQWWLTSWEINTKYFKKGDKRPHMIVFSQSDNITFHDLTLKNSASYHLKTDYTNNMQIYNINIKVNTTAQLNLYKRFSLGGALAIFPLNTDGIDPQGQNYHIYNISCQNYDDVVVPKPGHNKQPNRICTQNMLIENITVKLGVGLSIGSVPPNAGGNCIRNITFKNAYMVRPFKGIYLKTNLGHEGFGEFRNIHYQNITMDRPIWWAIYLGPQQQKQPGGCGPGCMLYPFDPKGTCQTQPRIDVRNITLKDIRVHKSLLFPFLLRCNSSNPCIDVSFQDVYVDSWLIGKKKRGFVCENMQLEQKNVIPKIECISTKDSNNQELKVRHIRNEYGESGWDDLIANQKQLEILRSEMDLASLQVSYQEEDDQMEIFQDRHQLVWSIHYNQHQRLITNQ